MKKLNLITVVAAMGCLFLAGCEDKNTETTKEAVASTEKLVSEVTAETTTEATTEAIIVKGSKEDPYLVNEVAMVDVFVRCASSTYESYSAKATFELIASDDNTSTWTLGIIESSTDSSIAFLDFAWPTTVTEKFGRIDPLIFMNEIDGGTYSWTTMYEGGEDTAYLSYYDESSKPKYVVIKYSAPDPNGEYSSIEKEIWFELP